MDVRLSTRINGCFVTGRIFLVCLRTKFAATASILLLSTTSFAVTANAVEAIRNDFFFQHCATMF